MSSKELTALVFIMVLTYMEGFGRIKNKAIRHRPQLNEVM